MKTIVPLSLIFTAMACSLGVAKEDDSETKNRSAWFLADTIKESFQNPTTIISSGESYKLLLSTNQMSAPVPIGDGAPLRIVKSAPDSEKMDKPSYQTLVTVEVSEKVKRALVLLALASNEKTPLYKPHVVDLAEFLDGQQLYANFSHKKIKVTLDELILELAPGEIKIAKFKNSDEPINIATKFEQHETEQEQWRTISSTYAAVRPTCREIWIFKSNEAIDRVAYQKTVFIENP